MLEGDIGKCCICGNGISPNSKYYRHLYEEVWHKLDKTKEIIKEEKFICEICYDDFEEVKK